MRKLPSERRFFFMVSLLFFITALTGTMIERYYRFGMVVPSEADLNAFVDTYATVYDLDPQKVRREIETEIRQDSEGHDYRVLLHNRVPLMVRRLEDNTAWEEATPDICGRLNTKQIYVYTTVDIAEPFAHEAYTKTYKKFSGIDPSGGFLQSGLVDTAEISEVFIKNAAQRRIPLRVHTSFFHQVIEEEMRANPTASEVNAFVDAHISAIFNQLEKYKNEIPSVEIIFANEPKWKSKSAYDWEESPLYSAYGEEWPVEVYVRLYTEAKKRGYSIGSDVRFMFNDFGIGIDSANPDTYTKADMVREHISEIKEGIADRLDIHADDVNMVVGFQGWAAFGDEYEAYYFFLDGNNLVSMDRTEAINRLSSNIVQFADVVDSTGVGRPVKITEIGTFGAGEDEQAEYVSRWTAAIKHSGRADSIGFWTPLRTRELKKGDDLSLFNVYKTVSKDAPNGRSETVGYMPRKAYYALNAALYN